MRPLILKENEEVVIVREMKKKCPYYDGRVFDVVFPDFEGYPNGDYKCLTVVLTDRDTMYIPEPFGRISRKYYAADTKPVKDNDLAQRIAKLVADAYQEPRVHGCTNEPWKLVVRRKMFHGKSQRRTK